MKTYLLTWNPKRWDKWDELAVEANKSASGRSIKGSWSCHANAKKIQKNDRVFLIRLGKEPKGIMAAGWVTSAPKLDEHWDPQKAIAGHMTYYPRCDWERLLNPFVDAPLPLSKLERGKLAGMHWTPEAPGIQIPPTIADLLEKTWAKHLGTSSLGNVYVDEEITGFEGGERLAFIRHRKREQRLRNAKLQQAQKNGGRLVCEVRGCGFDFEKFYGELGENYCQVHHLKPLSDRTTPVLTKLDDLAVVCANCHAMIHRGGECRPLDKLIP